MRTLVQTNLTSATKEEAEASVQNWLKESGFRPEAFAANEASKKILISSDQTDINSFQEALTAAQYHAFEILMAIPLQDHERQHALNTAKYAIRFDDQHGNTIWGLVCLDFPSISIRMRHRVSRSLEQATEEVVSMIWSNVMGDKAVFKKFASHHVIPVREPRSTSDAYIGEILPPGPLLKRRAKDDKKVEIATFNWMSALAVVCLLCGYFTFICSDQETSLRWASGAIDRLFTTALVTATISYLAYRFHYRELLRKPVIDWK